MDGFGNYIPYMSQALANSHRAFREQAAIVRSIRNQFNASELGIASASAEVLESMGLTNEAAQIPDDAWRDIDATTKRVMRDDEGSVFMNDLMPLARTVNIGKTVHMYRVSNDAGIVKRSMSGQVPDEMDKVTYDFRGHPVPLFSTSYGRNWREWLGQRSEGFDGLVDDQEAHLAAMRQDMAQYVLNGDAAIVTQGFQGYGIKNHPYTQQIDLSGGGFNIDLTSVATTSDVIETFFIRDVGNIMDLNLVRAPMTIYVSPQIMRRLEMSYSNSDGFKGGSLYDFLLSRERIGAIKRTYELSGNEFFMIVPNASFIRPLVGMAVSTVAMPRVMMTDDYNFRIMAAMGLEIRADNSGKSGVFYATD